MTDAPITQTLQADIIYSSIQRLWKSGLDTMAIAAMVGVHESYVYNLLAARPVVKRSAP